MPIANVALLGVPTDCTGNPGMCDKSPVVLRRLGAGAAVHAVKDFNDLSVRIDDSARDPATGVKGAQFVLETNVAVKKAVEDILRSGLKPVILGGCCSYLMGALAASRSVFGRIGLAFVDGHMDLYDGKTSPSGECADMPMAFTIGRGPKFLDDALGFAPLVEVADVSMLGDRDDYLARPAGSQLPEHLGPDLHHRDAANLKKFGLKETAAETLAFHKQRAGRYWIHLDWDILDETAFPSADYLMPGGLDWHGMVELVRPLVQSPMMIGLSTACYNPDNDPDRKDGKKIVEALGQIFA